MKDRSPMRQPLARHITHAARRAERAELRCVVHQLAGASPRDRVSEALTFLAVCLIALSIVIGGIFVWSVTP